MNLTRLTIGERALKCRPLVLCIATALALYLMRAPVALADSSAPQGSALQSDIRFSEYTPLANWGEVITRLMSPLSGMQVKRKLAELGLALDRQSVDLNQERFTVYVPADEPPQGFALLVFIPPWNDAVIPPGWTTALDKTGTIFVTMARSGNDEKVLDRRVPLTLLAAHNAMARYHIDVQHVYVGGFSGGSRLAMRISLAYPDVFRAALLNSGSDPIGNPEMPLPPEPLFNLFQSSTRLVYFTGQEDAVNVNKDAESNLSMRHWCVFNTDADHSFHQGHDVASAAVLQSALIGLSQAALSTSTDRLASCRSKLDQQLSQQLKQVDAAISAGRLRDAQKQLTKIDDEFGGMAAPRSVEITQKIESLTKSGAP